VSQGEFNIRSDAAPHAAMREPEVLRAELEEAAPMVRRYVFGMCGDWDVAEDVAQEALLKAWAKRSQFDGRAGVRTWLFTIARNHWRDCLRRKRTRGGKEQMQDGFETVASPEPAPVANARRRELREAIRVAVATLPPEQGEALSLRESDGLTFREVGEVLGIPTATAKSRVRYALLKLADELKPFRRELES